jgi:uncharacterized protein
MYAGDDKILIAAGCTPDIIAHCEAVSKKAYSLATSLKIGVDGELVRLGGLLHDIGRSRTQGIKHALAGAELAKLLGFSDEIIRIIERHIGAGITAAEAERLGLPKKDYLPITPEEKIVSYADNLISGTRYLSFPEALDRFQNLLGPHHEGIRLLIQQHNEIQAWKK